MKNDTKNLSKTKSNDFLLYTTPNGEIKVEVLFSDETIWATQDKIAQLFGVDRTVITKHLRHIYRSGELQENSTSAKIAQVQIEGGRTVSREITYYNLDAIISVGYRVNSSKATQFRIWATQRLKEYVIKGFAIDDERLKNGQYFGKDYFKELLERIRSIRTSERRVYLQITDIFQECSIDYDPNSQITKDFFATVQNKFHYAITGQTAAEIIFTKADKTKPNMGLSTWRSSPKGRILRSDVVVAKNYLSLEDISKLERTVSSFFDYIERIIETQNTFTMEEFAKSVGEFLNFNKYQILPDKGKISKEIADKKALSEYKEFNKFQKIENDFEKHLVKKHKTFLEQLDNK